MFTIVLGMFFTKRTLLLSAVIRWTGKAIAGGLSEIEQSPVRTGMATRDGFWVIVHAFVGSAISTKVFRLIVLQNPGYLSLAGSFSSLPPLTILAILTRL